MLKYDELATYSSVTYLATLAAMQGVPHEIRNGGNTLWIGAGTVHLPPPRIVWRGREVLPFTSLPNLTPSAAAIRSLVQALQATHRQARDLE